MIPLFKPYMPELPDMDTILHSGNLAYGIYTKQFEDKLKEYFNSPNLIVTNSFNYAISVALATMDIVSGDSVLASPMACLASTQPYRSSGLNVCWADVDNHLGTLDPDDVRHRITKNIKAIVHNHFCGYPGYIDEINAIGREYGIPVIDDGIECFGSEYKGKKIGNCGTDVTVFSLTAVRIPNTIDGGIVIFKDSDLYKKSLLVRDCGIDRTRFRDEIGEINPACDITLRGYSATMSNINGYIGLQQMRYVDDLLARQRSNASVWDKKISLLNKYSPLNNCHGNPNYWIYGIRSCNKKETIMEFRNNGYYASGVHVNNNIYSVFDNISLSGVTDFYNHFVALPCGWWFGNE